MLDAISYTRQYALDAPTMRQTVLTFQDGIPGFPGRQRFSVVSQPGLEPFMTLESVEPDGPSFVVVPPAAVVEGYEVPVDSDTTYALGIVDPGDVLVLAIVAVAAGGGQHTVNLLGPVVANRHSGLARQVVLVDSDYRLRQPLG
ncbi:MAG: flagellar assembly factor FliW [Frankiales bacterium]|jgi:flagellar assembly factor FliW|nr:flagellar assembly factor FliW [Frankiales bacterium]